MLPTILNKYIQILVIDETGGNNVVDEYKNIHKKINIELAWNEFIYTKYKNKIKIDEASIKEKIRTKKIKQKSEIPRFFFQHQQKKN